MLTDAILHVLYTSARGRFFMMPVFILGPFIALWGNHRCLRLLAILLAVPLGIIFGIANLVAGPQLLAALIHRYGAEGQATVTGSFDAGNSYNDRRVMGHNVLIKTADAQTIETSFADDDFNVYPPQNGVYYPQEGDVFNVSYIERFPQDFIIISNDDSPWAKSLSCHELNSALREADNKQQFAPDSADFRKAYEDAAQAARAAGCDPAETTNITVAFLI
jgi:hypothetical protein